VSWSFFDFMATAWIAISREQSDRHVKNTYHMEKTPIDPVARTGILSFCAGGGTCFEAWLLRRMPLTRCFE
jgi:hypothetical protein